MVADQGSEKQAMLMRGSLGEYSELVQCNQSAHRVLKSRQEYEVSCRNNVLDLSSRPKVQKAKESCVKIVSGG